MFIALIANSLSAETLLNNLSEADFNLDDVSIVMQNHKEQLALLKEGGPLKGARLWGLVYRLKRAGYSQTDIDLCTNNLKAGKVLVAMEVTTDLEAAAKEMFLDQQAQMIELKL